MKINNLVIEVQDVIVIEEQLNFPFVENICIPLKDWEAIKNYIDEQINSKATDSHK